MPTSSPSQLQTTSVRRGRMPSLASRPRARVSSIIEAVPLRGVDAAEYPGIAVVAQHNPFAGQFCAADAAFDDVVRLGAIVHVDFQMNFHALAAEVILNRQSTLPVVGPEWAIQIFEQRLGVVPGEWERHNFWSGN